MPEQDEEFQLCDACGATIYPEHLANGLAEQWEGKLLCVHCLRERRDAHATGEAQISLTDEPFDGEGATDDEPLVYDKKPTAIRSFGGGPGGMAAGRSSAESSLRRSLLQGSRNATRSRTFHCKLADAAFAHMSDQINEWADSSDDIEIKFATSCIGVVEGKHADPHLIVTVFY